MKQFLLILVSVATCGAGPIIYHDVDAFSNGLYLDPVGLEVSGAAKAIAGGYFLSLYNVPDLGYFRTATFSSDEPLVAWGGFFDNSPASAGTGMYVYADGVLIGSFGNGYFFNGYWGFHQETPFTTVTIATGVRNRDFYQEHLTLTGILAGYAPEIETYSDPPPAAVPEPSTLALVGVALIGMGYLRRKSSATSR